MSRHLNWFVIILWFLKWFKIGSILLDEEAKQARVWDKLMRLNGPPVKICFKSKINHVLIDFYNPNLEADFTRHDDTIPIRTIYIDSSSIYIKNWLNLIDNWSIFIKIDIFLIYIVVFNINHHFWLINQHLID